MLNIHEATRQFGGLIAVNNVSFAVEAGEILGVIGPNGAGKTTFFNLVSGAIPLSSGKIMFNGTDTGGLPAYRIAHLGIGRTFQIVRPFSELSVLENVLHQLHAFAAAVPAPEISRRGPRAIGPHPPHSLRE
jgi:ABC-type branched-subunit amino acid transport system ATPase component